MGEQVIAIMLSSSGTLAIPGRFSGGSSSSSKNLKNLITRFDSTI